MTVSQRYTKYLTSNSTQDGFTLSAGIRSTIPSASNSNHVALDVQDEKGLLLSIFGTGSDNGAGKFRIWTLTGCEDPSTKGVAAGYMLSLMGEGTFTLGTSVGASGCLVGSSERLADTLTFTPATTTTTPSGPGDDLAYALGDGSPRVYSPADNTVATLIMPTLYRGQSIIIEFDVDANTTSANAIVQRLKA